MCDDCSAGFSTTVLPNASAGAAFQSGIASGKFHGVISATTPSGSRSVNCSAPGTCARNHLADLAHGFAGVVAQDDHAAADLAARLADRLADLARDRLRELLLPVGDRRAQRYRCSARAGPVRACHGSNASAAARAACCASSAVPSGTYATMSLVSDGLTSAIQLSL